MKARTIYISLPISGHEDTYEQRLGEAVECVKKKFPNAEIITPKMIEAEVKAQLEHVDPTYGQYLGADIATIIDKCDAVVFCQGWEYSNGCTVEVAAATCSGKKKFYEWKGTITEITHDMGWSPQGVKVKKQVNEAIYACEYSLKQLRETLNQ